MSFTTWQHMYIGHVGRFVVFKNFDILLNVILRRFLSFYFSCQKHLQCLIMLISLQRICTRNHTIMSIHMLYIEYNLKIYWKCTCHWLQVSDHYRLYIFIKIKDQKSWKWWTSLQKINIHMYNIYLKHVKIEANSMAHLISITRDFLY